MSKQYWADAATINCVWLFQYKKVIALSWKYDEENEPTEEDYTDKEDLEYARKCYKEDYENQIPDEVEETWVTEAVFLTRIDAYMFGISRPYHWGKYNEDWRIYGVPCYGEMAERIGNSGFNQEESDKKVKEYIEFKQKDNKEE